MVVGRGRGGELTGPLLAVRSMTTPRPALPQVLHPGKLSQAAAGLWMGFWKSCVQELIRLEEEVVPS